MEPIFTLSNNLELIGFLITIFSLIFGIVQYLQTRKIKYLIALEAIELHNNIAMVLSATQAAKKDHLNGTSPALEIGRAIGLCDSILSESAKLYCNLKNTRLDDIDDLIMEGQLPNSYKEIYYSYSSTRRGWLRAILKRIRGFI